MSTISRMLTSSSCWLAPPFPRRGKLGAILLFAPPAHQLHPECYNPMPWIDKEACSTCPLPRSPESLPEGRGACCR